tara:strand:+ start:364 stop:558 length:195 start_codon:yes stop_codon:yes gene_type:complete
MASAPATRGYTTIGIATLFAMNALGKRLFGALIAQFHLVFVVKAAGRGNWFLLYDWHDDPPLAC